MASNIALDLRKAYKTTVLIGLAMMAGLIIYAVVVETIRKQNAPFNGFSPLPDVIATLRYALVAVAVAEFFVIQLVNKAMLSGKVPVRVPGAGQFCPEAQRLMSAAIVAFALCESVAIYGLVLFFIQGNASDFYLFLVISLFYFSFYFPKYGVWEEWIKEREKERSKVTGDGVTVRR